MSSDRRFTNAYASMASGIQTDAESKLGRALFESEANSIRNASSLMMLESVAMGMQHATTAEEVEARLADAASAFSDRLEDARKSVAASAESKLGRPLSISESKLVSGIQNCLVAMLVQHNIDDASALSDVSEVMP